MGELLPIFFVVLFWIVVGVLACWFFGRALRLPTESELEASHEVVAARGEHAQSATVPH